MHGNRHLKKKSKTEEINGDEKDKKKLRKSYNSNDRWKFILWFIRRENDLNKWLKHVKRGYGKQTK